jgi:F-type H+-transporting ATPase subunit delta
MVKALRQTSLNSMHSVGLEFGGQIQKLDERSAILVGHQFFAFAQAVFESVSLNRMLANPAKDASLKRHLVSELGKSIKAEKLVVEVVSALCCRKWSDIKDLFNACCEFGFNSLMVAVAKRHEANALKQVEDELFMMIRFLKDESTRDEELMMIRDILSSEGRPLNGRAKLLEDLFEKKVDEVSLLLAKYATARIRGGKRFVDSLQEVSNQIAAVRAKRVVSICTAVALTKPQQARLEGLLEKKYNSEIQMNIVIDPDMLGGIRIRSGGETFDDTVAGKVDLLNTALDIAFKK